MPAVRLCVRRTGPAAGSWLRAYRGVVTDRRGTCGHKGLDAQQLEGSVEIAERLVLRRAQTVHSWRSSDPSFPEFVAVLEARTGRRTYIWHWPDVEAWAGSRGFLLQGDG